MVERKSSHDVSNCLLAMDCCQDKAAFGHFGLFRHGNASATWLQFARSFARRSLCRLGSLDMELFFWLWVTTHDFGTLGIVSGKEAWAQSSKPYHNQEPWEDPKKRNPLWCRALRWIHFLDPRRAPGRCFGHLVGALTFLSLYISGACCVLQETS